MRTHVPLSSTPFSTRKEVKTRRRFFAQVFLAGIICVGPAVAQGKTSLNSAKELIAGPSLLTSTCGGPWTYVYSQSGRNNAIVAQAQLQVGSYGGQCKTWVYNVVYNASYVVNGGSCGRVLPATDSWNGEVSAAYYWISDPYVSGSCLPLGQVVPGQIIQMRVKYANGSYGPHTSIVEANNVATQSLTFLESNFSGDGIVKRRSVSYSDFIASLQAASYYTVYTIY